MSNGDFVKKFILEHPIISWFVAGSVLGTIKSMFKTEAPVVNVYNNSSVEDSDETSDSEETEEV